jgi:hypothetical protein
VARNSLYIFLFFLSAGLFSQTQVFKEGTKYGIKEKDRVIIQPVHDTLFNFDSTGRVCLACAKIRGAHPNKFIRTPVFSYSCSYISRNGERLVIQNDGDTSSIFNLHKTTVAHYLSNAQVMTVEVKNSKHLVDKDFKQLTMKGYDDIHFSADPQFLVAGKKNENGNMMYGLVNRKEEEVLPYRYSHIKINPADSLIIGCTAGQGANSEDDIYDFNGKKVASYHRHVELATKDWIIHKIFIPKEYLLVVNLKTKEEKVEYAEEAQYYKGNEVLMMNEGHWFLYDVITHKKKSYDPKHKK